MKNRTAVPPRGEHNIAGMTFKGIRVTGVVKHVRRTAIWHGNDSDGRNYYLSRAELMALLWGGDGK